MNDQHVPGVGMRHRHCSVERATRVMYPLPTLMNSPSILLQLLQLLMQRLDFLRRSTSCHNFMSKLTCGTETVTTLTGPVAPACSNSSSSHGPETPSPQNLIHTFYSDTMGILPWRGAS